MRLSYCSSLVLFCTCFCFCFCLQEIEFTVENGVLFVLESRNGKRTAKAALTIAVSMVTEKLINEREALLRVDPQQMDYFLHPTLDTNFRECAWMYISTMIYATNYFRLQWVLITRALRTCFWAEESEQQQAWPSARRCSALRRRKNAAARARAASYANRTSHSQTSAD
jgi:hypothetical protein